MDKLFQMQARFRRFLLALINTCCIAVLAVSLLAVASTEATGLHLQAEPTADPCTPATLTPANSLVNVRSGPSSDYAIVERLRMSEERSVVGRHWQYQWWQIETSDGRTGWVWDGVVEVSGNIAAVPAVGTGEADQPPGEGASSWVPAFDVVCVASSTTTSETIRVLAAPTPPAGTDHEELNANADGWGIPLNLSRSGLASEPQLVVDSSGLAHALWKEEGLDGFVYTRQIADAWMESTVVEVPFGTRRSLPDLRAEDLTPLFTSVLVADDAGMIHAFWVDGEGALRQSNVAAEAFRNFEAWTVPQVLADTALGIVATSGEGDSLHIAYIHNGQTEEGPVGIYHRHRQAGDDAWSAPTLLYESRYLGSVAGERAQLTISASRQDRSVYVAWDNPALEQIFLTRSNDGGVSWESPVLVDRRQPEDAAGATGPSHPELAAWGEDVLLLWQAGHNGASCTNYYQQTKDNGATWSAPQPLLAETESCLDHLEALGTKDDFFLFFVVLAGNAQMLAWDGDRWSKPEPQEALSSSVNPETFRPVTFACFNATLSGEEILVLACETGEIRDVWAASRSIPAIHEWFSEQVWSDPALLATTNSPTTFLELLTSAEGVLHALWMQESASDLNYARYEDGRWSEAATIATLTGVAGDPAVTLADGGNLLVTAWANTDGEIQLIEALVEPAISSSKWSSPVTVARAPMAPSGVALAAQGQRLYLAYAVPLNEVRGIYLWESPDLGRSWQVPSLAVDAAALGWTAVGPPQLAVTETGVVHLVGFDERWTAGATETAAQSFYARVEPGATVPVTPQPLTEEPVRWARLLPIEHGGLHRLWQEVTTVGLGPIHQVSGDSGLSWSEENLTSNWVGPAAVAADSSGRLHLLQVNGTGLIEYRRWDGGRWSLDEATLTASTAGPAPGTAPDQLAATISNMGDLALLWTGESAETESEFRLFAARRSIVVEEEPVTLSVALPTPAMTPEVTPAPTASPTPTRIATLAVAERGGGGASQQSSSQTMQLLLAFIPAFLFIGTAVVLVLVARRRRPRLPSH